LESGMTDSAKFVDNTFRYERIDGAGHWFQWEQPDKVAGLLVDFLPH
jgi:pimeloyl-ACP methyl ester carboxylesterase